MGTARRSLVLHFHVYWSRPGFGRAFEADVHAVDAFEARDMFRALFPTDHLIGVKRRGGNGRWEA